MKKQSIFKHPDIGIVRETLSVSNYLIEETKWSKIDKSVKTSRVVGMKCPHCKNRGEEIPHGSFVHCLKCGLKMTVHGNALDCELDTYGTNYASKENQ